MITPFTVLILAVAGLIAPSVASSESTLFANDFLFYGQTIVAPGCRYRLTMQYDGNLVLYAGNPGMDYPVWASDTVGHKGYAVMQADGNFVMYNWNGVPFWATGTHGHPGARLVIQDDQNLVVYRGSTPVWAAGTHTGQNLGISPCLSSSSVTVTEPGVNRWGGDYVSYAMSKAEYSHCAYWCSQDTQCHAFTYVPPGVQGSTAMCWLKDSVPAASYAPGLVSGYILRD